MAKRRDPRLSHQGLQVLRVFFDEPKGSFAGADIWRRTGVIAGTLYPILARFELAGWLDSDWEQVSASEAGRPRRRLYTLTPKGYNKANEALAQLGIGGRSIWAPQ
jgi:PadR family transcriptional regulator, regulatory protein PadR